jgi:hypothetical protein
MRLCRLSVALFIAGCAGDRMQVVGRCADRLSASDVRQIALVGRTRHDRVRIIYADYPTRVRVLVGPPDDWTRLVVVKRDGSWLVHTSAGAGAMVPRTAVRGHNIPFE